MKDKLFKGEKKYLKERKEMKKSINPSPPYKKSHSTSGYKFVSNVKNMLACLKKIA